MLESLNYSFRKPKNIIWVIYRIKQLKNYKKKTMRVLREPQLGKQRWRARLGILRVNIRIYHVARSSECQSTKFSLRHIYRPLNIRNTQQLVIKNLICNYMFRLFTDIHLPLFFAYVTQRDESVLILHNAYLTQSDILAPLRFIR